MREKRSSVPNEAKKKKEPIEKAEIKSKKKPVERSIRDKEKRPKEEDKSDTSKKEVFDGVKELRKNPERERVLKKKKHSIESKTEIQDKFSGLERKNLRISTSVVRDTCKKLESGTIDTERMSRVVEELYSKSKDSKITIHYANLSEVLPKDTTRRIEEIIQGNKEEIEKTIQTQLGIDKTNSQLRIASVEGRLYIWTRDQSKNDMLNAWSKQYLYFKDKKAQSAIENRALSNLQLNALLWLF